MIRMCPPTPPEHWHPPTESLIIRLETSHEMTTDKIKLYYYNHYIVRSWSLSRIFLIIISFAFAKANNAMIIKLPLPLCLPWHAKYISITRECCWAPAAVIPIWCRGNEKFFLLNYVITILRRRNLISWNLPAYLCNVIIIYIGLSQLSFRVIISISLLCGRFAQWADI